MSSTVSVIICSYNRAHLLQRTLHSLAEQTMPQDRFEVIVVDDGSDDDTAMICETMRSRLKNLRYVSNGKNIGLARARNAGVSESLGKYLLFTDDDCIPHKNWIERLRSTLEHEMIVAGAVTSTSTNYFKLCHNISQFHAFMPGNKDGPIEFIAGANMALQRSVLEKLNGFENVGCAEDTEFILRARSAGYRVFYAHDAVVIHDPDRTTLMDILKYSSTHAATTILLRNRFRSLLRTPFIMKSPALTILAAPLIALKVTASIYLRNLSLAKFFWTAPVVYGLKLAWCWGAVQGLRQQNNSRKNNCPGK